MNKETTMEEMIRDFVNKIAFKLKPSNDTMDAVRAFRAELPSLISLAVQEERKKNNDFIIPRLQKFIDKVDSGRARSKETYQDLKDIINLINKD